MKKINVRKSFTVLTLKTTKRVLDEWVKISRKARALKNSSRIFQTRKKNLKF